jgi:hypothetical protein
MRRCTLMNGESTWPSWRKCQKLAPSWSGFFGAFRLGPAAGGQGRRRPRAAPLVRSFMRSAGARPVRPGALRRCLGDPLRADDGEQNPLVTHVQRTR